MADGAGATDEGGGAGGVLMTKEDHHTLAAGVGEDLCGDGVVPGDEEGAGPVVDGVALDDGAVPANDEELLDISLGDGLLEALVDGGLGRRADSVSAGRRSLRRSK